MKKHGILLLLSAALLLSGCTGSDEPSFSRTSRSSRERTSKSSSSESLVYYSDDPTKEITDDSISFSTSVTNGIKSVTVTDLLLKFKKDENDYYGGTFEKKLPEPSSTVNSHQELVDLFDYCAFYRIKEKEIAINYEGDLIEECNLAVWDSNLLPGTVGTVFTSNRDNVIKAEFKYVDNANSFVPRDYSNGSEKSIFPYIYDYNSERRKLITEIPYSGNEELDVHNSDQLIYAITHGYNPIMQTNSPAAKIFEAASNILKNIIYEYMSANEKLTAIDFYLSNSNQYDYVSDDSAAFISDTHRKNVEELASMFRGFYAEGALLNGGAVCYGFAKAQALLAGLLGFQVKLTHGKIDQLSKETNDAVKISQLSGNIYNAHGICLVRKDENSKWGICDPTYRSAGSVPYNEDRVDFKRAPAIMLTPEIWSETYETADEVALRYIPREEIVDTPYNFVDDYRLVGGAKINPMSQFEIERSLKGVVDTIKKAKDLSTDKRITYYCVTFYPKCLDDAEANEIFLLYKNLVDNSSLKKMGCDYYGWNLKEYMTLYGFTIYLRY